MLSSIDRAKAETQFSKSIDLVKDAIPDGLKVQGHNPLKRFALSSLNSFRTSCGSHRKNMKSTMPSRNSYH